MSFADNPIVNSPFEKPQWHFELDDEGQPTGKKLAGRRESVQVIPVPAARRRGPRQRELALEEKTTDSPWIKALLQRPLGMHMWLVRLAAKNTPMVRPSSSVLPVLIFQLASSID